jgi:hypothetical protein
MPQLDPGGSLKYTYKKSYPQKKKVTLTRVISIDVQWLRLERPMGRASVGTKNEYQLDGLYYLFIG